MTGIQAGLAGWSMGVMYGGLWKACIPSYSFCVLIYALRKKILSLETPYRNEHDSRIGST